MDIQDKPHSRRGRFLGLAILLWFISGLVTVSLFLDLAGDNLFRQTLAVLWAGSLEATKIVSWQRGGWLRWLSVGLMALTLFSAMGMAFATVEGSRDRQVQEAVRFTSDTQDRQRVIDGLVRQVDVLVGRLEAIPNDYTTAAANLTRSLEATRSRLDAAVQELHDVEMTKTTQRPTGPFDLVAGVFAIDRRLLEIGVIMVVALLTEVSALAMAGIQEPAPNRAPVRGAPTQFSPTEDDYLRVALDHPRAPRLLGRLEVAKRLGVHENEARILLQRLVDQGRVRRGSKSFEVSGGRTN